MYVSASSTVSYAELFASRSNQRVVSTAYTPRKNMDSVSISPEAMQKLNEAKGAAPEPEMDGMGKLFCERMRSYSEYGEEDTYTLQTTILDMNYIRLQAIENEIANGNTSQELQDQKLLIALFGDVRELSVQDFQEGTKLLNELMPERDNRIQFEKIVSALRKAYGVGGEDSLSSDEAEETEELSPETKLLLEELESFIRDTGGISLDISIKDNHKETRVTKGARGDEAKAVTFAVTTSVPAFGESEQA